MDNTFLNDGLLVYNSYQNTVINNTINGKPLIYLEDESDMIIDNNAGQVILVNCDNITVQNQDLSNTDVGIELWNTHHSLISGNTITNNCDGLYLYYSSNNTITGNTITNNCDGLYLHYFSSNNTITGNTVINNGNDGLYLYYLSSNNTITGNTITNNCVGLYLHYFSSNNTITGNTITNNCDGLYLDDFSNNTITGNTITNNYNGLYLHYSGNNTIYHNNIYGNAYYGIYNYDPSSTYTANASYNYWGSVDGPSGVGSGSGDAVSSNVIYEPWLTKPWGEEYVNAELSIDSQHIEFSDTNVSNGEEIIVSALVCNDGNDTAWNVNVAFYAINITSNQTMLIGKDVIDVGAWQANYASISWQDHPAGLYMIKVVVDPDNKFNESDKSDNVATRIIAVGMQGLPGGIEIQCNLQQSYNPGDIVAINGKAKYTFGPWNVSRGHLIIEINSHEEHLFYADMTDADGNFYYNFRVNHIGKYWVNITVGDNTFLTTQPFNFTVEPIWKEGKDLICQQIAFSDSTPAYWQSITAYAKIINVGQQDATNVKVNFYDLGSVVEPQNVYLGSVNLASINGRGGFAVASLTFTFTPQDENNYWENHRIKVIVDPEDSIDEVDESNNEMMEKITGHYGYADLTGEISIYPDEVVLGETSVIGIRIINNGEQNINQPFTVKIYDGLTEIGREEINSLEMGESTTINMIYNPLSQGSHLITANIDADGNITESSEFNNILLKYLQVHPPLPDFKISGISFIPYYLVTGETVQIKVTIRNNGWKDGSATVTLYDGLQEIGNSCTGTIFQKGSRDINIYYTPQTTGYHTFEAVVSPDGDEINPFNNMAARIKYVYPDKPDAEPIDIYYSDSTPYDGQGITIYAKIKNCGGKSIENMSIRFYDNNTLIGERVVNIYPFDQLTTTYVYHTFNSVGYHTLKVIADQENHIAEYNEGNNEREETVYVHEPLPDLTVTHVTFSKDKPIIYETINILATIKNWGEASAQNITVGFYANNIYLGQRNISLTMEKESATVSIPWTTNIQGYNSVTVKVDEDDEIEEYNENNNVLTRTIYVYPPLPDLTVTSISAIGTDSYPGCGHKENINIQAKIDNIEEDGQIASCYVALYVDDKLIDYTYVTNIQPGGSKYTTLHWEAIGGEHYIKVVADPWNGVMETNEYNNAKTEETYITKPDVSMNCDDIIFSNPNPSPGQTLAINVTIHNVGDIPALDIPVSIYAADGLLTTQLVDIGVNGGITLQTQWQTPLAVANLSVIRVEANCVDANPSDNKASRGIVVGNPENITLYIKPILIPSQVEKGLLICYYQVTDQNGYPINGVEISFNSSIGNKTFFSKRYGNDDGILCAEFNLSNFGYNVFNADIKSAKIVGIPVNFVPIGTTTIHLVPHKTNLLMEESGYGEFGIGLVAGASSTFSFLVENDGSNITNVDHIFNFKGKLGAGIGIGIDLAAVNANIGAEFAGGALYEQAHSFDNISDEEQSQLINYLVTLNILDKLSNSPDPSIRYAATQGILYILLKMGSIGINDYINYTSAGIFREGEAGAWSRIGIDDPYASSYDFSLLQAGVTGKPHVEAKKIIYADGSIGYEGSVEIEAASGIYLPGLEIEGPDIDVKYSVELIQDGFNIKSIRYTIETVMDKEEFESMKLNGDNNLLNPIKNAPLDWSGGGERKIIIQYEIPVGKMASNVIELLNNMQSNIEFYNLSQLILQAITENTFYPYEIWEEIPWEEEDVGISLDLLGLKIAGGRSFFEGEKFLVENGYIYRGYEYPLAKFTVRPESIDVIDFLQKCWDGRAIMKEMLGRDVIIIGCPVNITLEDEYGRVIGYKNGSFVNEIPESLCMNVTNHTIFYLPGNLTYTLYLEGYDYGEYDLQLFTNDSYSLHITNASVTPSTHDIFKIENGSLNINASESKNIFIEFSQVMNKTSVMLSIENLSLNAGKNVMENIHVYDANPSETTEGANNTFFKCIHIPKNANEMRITYSDDEIKEFNESSLQLYKYNDSQNRWIVYNASYDFSNNTMEFMRYLQKILPHQLPIKRFFHAITNGFLPIHNST